MMALNWQSPSGEDFADTFYEYLKIMEGPAPGTGDLLHPISVNGNPTIGVGFDLVAGGAAVQREVLHQMGFDYVDIDRTQAPAAGTPAAEEYGYLQQLRAQMVKGGSIDAMNKVMSARLLQSNTDPLFAAYAPNQRASFSFNDETEVRAAYDILLPIYEAKVFNKYPELASDAGYSSSREKMVLTDLAWNGGTGILGSGLGNAIKNGNRAEAWFQIRYGSNGGNSISAGLANSKGSASHYFLSRHATSPTH